MISPVDNHRAPLTHPFDDRRNLEEDVASDIRNHVRRNMHNLSGGHITILHETWPELFTDGAIFDLHEATPDFSPVAFYRLYPSVANSVVIEHPNDVRAIMDIQRKRWQARRQMNTDIHQTLMWRGSQLFEAARDIHRFQKEYNLRVVELDKEEAGHWAAMGIPPP